MSQKLTTNRKFEKGRPLPKFGEWDVNDPASAEGFTVIFNKARDEKKTGGKPESPGKVDPNIRHGGGVDPGTGRPSSESFRFTCKSQFNAYAQKHKHGARIELDSGHPKLPTEKAAKWENLGSTGTDKRCRYEKRPYGSTSDPLLRLLHQRLQETIYITKRLRKKLCLRGAREL
uniref:Predocted uncharacterized protein LOC103967858 isoform X1 n=1 Tax=Malus domestica TaxID=3750 RepID=A0A4Y1QC72_MALDO|nr:predocted uncharacterized protein LOC103967858 isoform X1 [Malus domestica]